MIFIWLAVAYLTGMAVGAFGMWTFWHSVTYGRHWKDS